MAKKSAQNASGVRSQNATSKSAGKRPPKSAQEATPEMEVLTPSSIGAPSVHHVRGNAIILDEDLAPRLGVPTKRLNEIIKRNVERFPEDWVFQLSPSEYANLGARIKTVGSGGRRYLPWAFTEHGVVMAASVVRSPAAIQAMHLVVSVFVEARKNVSATRALIPARSPNAMLPAAAADGLSARLKTALDRVLDTIIDHKNETTVRQEALSVVSEAISSLKERLKKAGAENEALAAKATKLLAQAEKEKAVAAKKRAETDQIEFATLARKLRLVMEAEMSMQSGDIRSFLDVLDKLSGK